MLLIVDGTNLAHRAYHALKATPTGIPVSAQGIPIASIGTVLRSLLTAIREYRCSSVAVVFDNGLPTWRHEVFPGYKAHDKERDERLIQDIDLLRDALELAGIGIVAPAGYEADDLIGAIAQQSKDEQVLLYSGDRDLFQLVSDRIWQIYPRHGKQPVLLVQPEQVVELMGVNPNQIADYKALCGDKSDNISGIKGIGEKIALPLLRKYNTIGGIYENISLITGRPYTLLKRGKEAAELSKKLALLKTDIPMSLEFYQQIKISNIDLTILVPTLLDLGLSTIAQDYEKLVTKGL
jgi:DNA polymerase-1